MNPKALNQSRDLLLGCDRPLLVTHVDPDGDAVGGLLALGCALEALGKMPLLACSDPLPPRFGFLPGFHRVTTQPQGSFDLVVALDCADRARMGLVSPSPQTEDVPLLNIDHHATNANFGTVNLVDAEAVSTTYILHRLLRHMGVAVDGSVATCLLTGLVTDTRGFRTSNVDAGVIRLAAELMEVGAPLAQITRQGLDRQPLGMLRLWGAALSRLEAADGVVWTSLPLAVQQACGRESGGETGLANLLVGAEGARIAALFTEREDGQVEVGLRAVPGFDVASIALALGGGGHTLAAGCVVPGPLDEAQRRVLAVVRDSLAGQRERGSGEDGRHTQRG